MAAIAAEREAGLPIYHGGDVLDGRGEVINRVNAPYNELISIYSPEYRATKLTYMKRIIAGTIYYIIKIRASRRFLDEGGHEKTEAAAIHKIMKSLKDSGRHERELVREEPRVVNEADTVSTPSTTITQQVASAMPLPNPAVLQQINNHLDNNDPQADPLHDDDDLDAFSLGDLSFMDQIIEEEKFDEEW
jgi:hypothetical protein